MKIAFHFKCDVNYCGNYILPMEELIFLSLKNCSKRNISTKWFAGDLVFSELALDRKDNESSYTLDMNREKYIRVINKWLNPDNQIFQKIEYQKIADAIKGELFTIGAENLDIDSINMVHETLLKLEHYLGVQEVDETSKIHWLLYSHFISPQYRQINDKLFIFWNGLNEDNQDSGIVEHWKKKGFAHVEYESLNGRYTFFDGLHNFDHARRVATFKKRTANLLGYLVDEVISRLQDGCPEIGNKFWVAIKSFDNAESNEEYAHVATSCRRIIEYVADNIFPPTDEKNNGFELGKGNYRNRLLAFADRERKSETNIDVISASTKMLAEQLEKLSNLQNKGVHDQVMREEARRCLIRTIIILDDILALKKNQFETKINLDTSWLHNDSD